MSDQEIRLNKQSSVLNELGFVWMRSIKPSDTNKMGWSVFDQGSFVVVGKTHLDEDMRLTAMNERLYVHVHEKPVQEMLRLDLSPGLSHMTGWVVTRRISYDQSPESFKKEVVDCVDAIRALVQQLSV